MYYPTAGWTLKGKMYVCHECQQKQTDKINYDTGWWWFDTYHLNVFLVAFYCKDCERMISNLV